MKERRRVLVINPGSTSTKAGVFVGDRQEEHSSGTRASATVLCERSCNLQHPDHQLEMFRGWPAPAQCNFRAAAIQQALEGAGYGVHALAAVAGRGGLLPPMECGTWQVNDAMIEQLRPGAPRRARMQFGSTAGPRVRPRRRSQCLHCRSRDGGRVGRLRTALRVTAYRTIGDRPRAQHQSSGPQIRS